MKFLDLVKERRSVRTYSTRDIEDEKLQYIIEAARLAPSAANKQPWKFFFIKDKQIQELLKQGYKSSWFAKSDCPYYILACGDTNQSWKRKFDDKDHCDIDVSIAFEHICLAAAEQELGTCWICAFDPELIRSLFELPENMYPMAITPLGYPDEMNIQRTPRKDADELIEII